MYKIDDEVSDSGYTTWVVLDTEAEFSLLCACVSKEDAELILEALVCLDELNKGFC